MLLTALKIAVLEDGVLMSQPLYQQDFLGQPDLPQHIFAGEHIYV